MIVDPHIHSKFSLCSQIGIKDLFTIAIRRNIDALIITDHNVLSKQIITKIPDEYHGILKVFIGSEITSNQGDILAYGISKEIPNGLTPQKTIELIHDQGGIAVAAHPYRCSAKKNHYSMIGLGDEIFSLELDAIETINGGNRPDENLPATKSAKVMNLPGTGGSDAHSVNEIGRVVMLTPEFDTIEQFIDLVKNRKCSIRSDKY